MELKELEVFKTAVTETNGNYVTDYYEVDNGLITFNTGSDIGCLFENLLFSIRRYEKRIDKVSIYGHFEKLVAPVLLLGKVYDKFANLPNIKDNICSISTTKNDNIYSFEFNGMLFTAIAQTIQAEEMMIIDRVNFMVLNIENISVCPAKV